jgi:hypothetical protein
MSNYPDALYALAVEHQRTRIAEAEQHRLLAAIRGTRRTRRARRAVSGRPERDAVPGSLTACGSPAAAPATS